MLPTLAFPEAISRFLSGKARSLQLGAGILRSAGRPSGADSSFGRFDQTRCLAAFARSGNHCVGSSADGVHVLPIGTSRGFAQTRQFLGLFFGEDCSALSKVYKERRTIGYEQLFSPFMYHFASLNPSFCDRFAWNQLNTFSFVVMITTISSSLTL